MIRDEGGSRGEPPQTSTGDVRHGIGLILRITMQGVPPRGTKLFSPARKRWVSGTQKSLGSQPLQGRHNMPHSYISSVLHIVFSTKQRTHLIPSDHQPRLWNYLAGIARNHGMHVLAVGGTANHVHLLIVLPAETALADAVRTLKATPVAGCGKRRSRLHGSKDTEPSALARHSSNA